jgi:hypothetical protein
MISEDSSAKRSFSEARPAARLRDELDKRLLAYSISAIAAGVGVLAISQSAYAEVVYTPAHIKIPLSNTETVPLDLNHDGRADFSFANRYFASIYFWLGLRISPVTHPNAVWGQGRGNDTLCSHRFASALPAGRTVRANKSYFQAGGSFPPVNLATVLGSVNSLGTNTFTQGQFPYAHGRYLGLRFVINGKIHYGWARVSVPSASRKSGITAVVTGYAYETIPDKPIITGKTKGPDVVTLQPATLGHLATGASAIPAWRVKRTAATTH